MKSVETTTQPDEKFTRLLIGIQCKLDQEITLESLADEFGCSPFHFHRLFVDAVGETPRKYVERLRLEKAIYKLLVTNESVLDVGLAVGFNNHESFSRSFKRYFGKSPATVRKEGRDVRAARAANPRSFRCDECFMSEVRYESLQPMTLLCIRHLGDYQLIPHAFTEEDLLWNRLVSYAQEQRVPFRRIPIGIFYDNPFMTPMDQQRCDACIPIEKAVEETPTIRCLNFAGGKYGMIEHIGPVDTLASAFRTVASEICASDKFEMRDDPPIEILRPAQLRGNEYVDHTDVYLPVRSKPVAQRNS